MLTAFSTASSNATLPTALLVADRELKLPSHVSRFVLTIGSTANQNGTALFEGVTVLFLAQLYGVDLSFAQQLGVGAVAAVTDPWVAWIDTVRPLDLALVIAPFLAFLLAIVPLLDLRIERDALDSVVAVRVHAVTANLVVATLAVLVGAALIFHIVTESVLRVGA